MTWFDGALIAVHRIHHQREDLVEELARLLGVAVGQQLHRGLQVGEEHGHLLALALQGTPGGHNLLGQIGRGIAHGLRGWWEDGSWGEGLGWEGQRRTTAPTELEPWRVLKPTLPTATREGSATLPAEFHALRILKATARATHGCALRHGRTSG